ncbi:uncharacterized protein YxjI [Roseateles asaccharophilus]|uniref:hypothetical protein n=1 Tax=Roseateles asaccharophilus TaxID=582607 RepID=UPI0038389D99
MARQLSISSKLLTLKQRFHIQDELGNPIYETTWKFGWLRTFWHITKGGREVAKMRRKLLAFRETWIVHVGEHEFQLRRGFSFSRVMHVIGGPFHGASLRGSLWDMSFRLERGTQVIAEAAAKLFTLTGRHTIELKIESSDSELLSAIMMTNLLLQKSSEAAASQSDD